MNLPETSTPATTPPALEPASDSTLSITQQFLNGDLPFQASPETSDGGSSPATAEAPPENESFTEQSARLGWSANGQQPAQPAATPAAQPAAQQATPVIPPGGRDYNGLPPEDVALFKQMGNAAYAKLRPIYDHHREYESKKAEREAKEQEREKLIAELKGQHFYDIPDAHQLDPEIRPLMQAQQQLASEADFWQKQLASIDKNEKIQLLVVGQDGQPTLTPPLDPEPEHRAMITRAMQDALTKHAQVSSQVTQNVQNFKARYQGWDEMIQQQTQNVFGRFEKHIAKSRDEILNQFPPALRHKPIYGYAANATAAIAMLLKDNQRLQQQVAGAKLNQPAIASATPAPNANGSGTPDRRSHLEEMARMIGRPQIAKIGA